jgi:CelD/BcsL family acetyltransferase involved in cellulose biosynthesis
VLSELHETTDARGDVTVRMDQGAERAGSRIIRDSHDLERSNNPWSTLELAANSPTQHFVWSQACATAFTQRGELSVTVVGDPIRFTAVAPLIKTKGLIPRLESIGVSELFEPMDFLYEDPSSLSRLLRALVKQGIPLLLLRVPADSPVIAALKDAYAGRGWVHTSPGSPYPHIDLTPEWAEPESQFNSRRRSDLRRAQRHAAEAGEVTFEVLSPEPSQLEPLLAEAFDVEARSWKGSEGTALNVDPVRSRFFRQYTAAALAKGILRMVFMRINGRAVGMQIALECHDRFWLLKIGYDESYARCSPGTLLMLHSVRYAASRGLRSYEFLGGAAPWTSVWTKSLRECVVVRAYPASVPGVAALAVDTTRWGLNQLEKKLEARREKASA